MTCEDCKYWSELVAASVGNGPLKAMCLNVDSPHYTSMVHRGCDRYEAGRSVDCPVTMEGNSHD